MGLKSHFSFIGQRAIEGQKMGIMEIEALLKETYNFYTFKLRCILQKKIPQGLKNVVPW